MQCSYSRLENISTPLECTIRDSDISAVGDFYGRTFGDKYTSPHVKSQIFYDQGVDIFTEKYIVNIVDYHGSRISSCPFECDVGGAIEVDAGLQVMIPR